ncbi:MAG: hypothetical protein QOC56_1853 [Alphaproteobacteria bacterium]|nr:hypothetical protein [Alphaproteobacteria bacterium]
MLPSFRFLIGTALACVLLIVSAFGLAASMRLAQQTRVTSIEASRTLAFAERADLNQFFDADGLRRFGATVRLPDSVATELRPELVPSIEPAAPLERVAAIPPEATATDETVAHVGVAPAAAPALDAVLPGGPGTLQSPAVAATEPAPPLDQFASLPPPPETPAVAETAEPPAPAERVAVLPPESTPGGDTSASPEAAPVAKPKIVVAPRVKAKAKAKAKVAKARKARARKVVRAPAARSKAPASGQTFDSQYFR